jgi:hypothetical protein
MLSAVVSGSGAAPRAVGRAGLPAEAEAGSVVAVSVAEVRGVVVPVEAGAPGPFSLGAFFGLLLLRDPFQAPHRLGGERGRRLGGAHLLFSHQCFAPRRALAGVGESRVHGVAQVVEPALVGLLGALAVARIVGLCVLEPLLLAGRGIGLAKLVALPSGLLAQLCEVTAGLFGDLGGG